VDHYHDFLNRWQRQYRFDWRDFCQDLPQRTFGSFFYAMTVFRHHLGPANV
jgi:hypothetical protein